MQVVRDKSMPWPTVRIVDMSFSLIGSFFVSAAAALAGVPAAVPDVSPQQPSGLMCELLAAPENTVIVDAAPELSWIVNSAEAGDYQIAYRIRVTAGHKPVWDSGRVESDRSVSVEYGGRPLAPNGTYAWQVKVWTKRAGESPWSEPQRFTMAKETAAYATSGYPLVQTSVAPAVIVKKGADHFFIDFGRVAFGYLTLEFDAPVPAELEIHLAERGSPDGVNRSPEGTVRYVEVKQPVRPGLRTYLP